MHLRWFLAALFLTLPVFCLGEERKLENNPSAVAVAFMNAIGNADLPALRNLIAPEGLPELDKLPPRQKTETTSESVSEKMDGDRATVSVRVSAGGRSSEETVPLTRVHGEWRVDLLAVLKDLRPKLARAVISNLHNMLIFRQAHTKSLPTMEEGLGALTKVPPDGFLATRGPMMKKIPLDPWGSPYRYEIPAKWNKSEKFDVFSIGPDKQPYTDDDIGNWDFGWPPPDKKPAGK